MTTKMGLFDCMDCYPRLCHCGKECAIKPEEVLAAAERAAIRRERVCKHAPECPKCRTKQVQIIDCRPLAKWKCRHCKHTWRHEPLISNASLTGAEPAGGASELKR